MLKLSQQFAANASWESFVHDFRGRSYLSPTVETIDHPATQLLRRWRDKRVPASTTNPAWTLDQKDHCVQRGCHISATLHPDFLRQEMAKFIESKFWVVLPYKRCDTCTLSCSPQLPSKKNETGSFAYSVTIPCPGLGVMSMKSRYHMPLWK